MINVRLERNHAVASFIPAIRRLTLFYCPLAQAERKANLRLQFNNELIPLDP